MLIKLKYKGTTGGGLTQNNIYVVLGIDCPDTPRAVVIDDNGVPQKTGDISNTSNWEIDSVVASGCITIV